MTIEEKSKIIAMRKTGCGYTAIARALSISVNTIKSICRREDIGKTAETACPQCGKPVHQREKIKRRRFCSDPCRMKWWRLHPELLKPRISRQRICAYCGQPFVQRGSRTRKYCCRGCYDKARSHADE